MGPQLQMIMGHLTGFFFCASTILFTFSTFGTVFMLLATQSMQAGFQFAQMQELMGPTLMQLPLYFGAFGTLTSFIGLISWFMMMFSEHYTFCCLATCAASFPLAGYGMLKLTQAVLTVRKTAAMVKSHAFASVSGEDVYQELRNYVVKEKKGDFSRVQRGEFLERFGANVATHSGYVVHMLASRIFDEW